MRTLLACLWLIPSVLNAQVLKYAWPNQPCGAILNCDTGCTACNLPAASGSTFMGNNAGFLGVDVCPHPVATGDNALFTYGWPSAPDDDHAVIVTGLAFAPTRIDSILVRHRRGPDGPQRLQVRFGINENMPATVIGDVPAGEGFGNVTFTGLGLVAAEPAMVYGYFSLLLQPYSGAGGSWDLDELRIVGSPDANSMPDLLPPAGARRSLRFDALGRPVHDRRAVRFYFDGTRRIALE